MCLNIVNLNTAAYKALRNNKFAFIMIRLFKVAP